MAIEKKVRDPIQKEKTDAGSARTELPKSGDTKVRFLVWFTGALDRFEGVKAHHLHAVKVYFAGLGLGDPETIESYDQALIKFGYGRK